MLLRIVSRVHFRMCLGDSALLVDDVGDPLRVFVFRGVGGTVGDTDLAVGVTQQREGEAEFLGKAGVGIDVVETGAEDGGVFRFVRVDEVPEPGTLGRSAGGVGFREKPQHDFLAPEVAKRDLLALVIGDFEIGRRIADLQHRTTSDHCFPRIPKI